MLNTKEGVLGTVCAFETLVYIMRSDCCVVEVFNTESQDKLCKLVHVKIPTELNSPILLPLDEEEVFFVRQKQDQLSV